MRNVQESAFLILRIYANCFALRYENYKTITQLNASYINYDKLNSWEYRKKGKFNIGLFNLLNFVLLMIY